MNSSLSIGARALALAGAVLASSASAQTVHYASGFETPTYQLGTLAGSTFSNGQDGWLATGDSGTDPILSKIKVQSALTHGGAQGVEIDATGQPCAYAHIRRHTFINAVASEPLFDIAFDMRIAQAATTRSEWGIQAQAGPGPGSGILEWWIDVAGELHITGATGFLDTGVVLNRDQWYRVVTRLDFEAQTCSVSIDGQVAGTVPALSGAQFWAHAFTSLMFMQPGDDRMYVDNFSQTTHDGTTIATYCTAGTTTNGCNASLAFAGTPSASAANGFTLTASNVEGQKLGVIFYGVSGRVASPWGNGGSSFLCVKPPTMRTGVQSSGGGLNQCSGTLALDWNAFRAAHPNALGAPFSAGQVVNAQAWFRDPPAVRTSNLSNAIEFQLQL